MSREPVSTPPINASGNRVEEPPSHSLAPLNSAENGVYGAPGMRRRVASHSGAVACGQQRWLWSTLAGLRHAADNAHNTCSAGDIAAPMQRAWAAGAPDGAAGCAAASPAPHPSGS